MRELPDRYLLEPLELLLCADDSEIPMWVMCVWDDAARQWFAGDRMWVEWCDGSHHLHDIKAVLDDRFYILKPAERAAVERAA